MRVIIDLDTHYYDRDTFQAKVASGWPQPSDPEDVGTFVEQWPNLHEEYPLLPGAREAVWVLLRRGWDIHFLTTRDSRDLERVATHLPAPLNQRARFHHIATSELAFHDWANWVAPAHFRELVSDTQKVWSIPEIPTWELLLNRLIDPGAEQVQEERQSKARKAASAAAAASSDD